MVQNSTIVNNLPLGGSVLTSINDNAYKTYAQTVASLIEDEGFARKSDLTSIYVENIWENFGDTIRDSLSAGLSNYALSSAVKDNYSLTSHVHEEYVEKTTKVAGKQLTGDISPSDISSAIGLSNYQLTSAAEPNDSTISILQGGELKGAFTLNQASDMSIELDAGGGGGGGTPPASYKTYSSTLASLSNDGYATQAWVNSKGYSKVSVQQQHSTGTQIATITVDGQSTQLYAPTAGEPVQPNNPKITIKQGGVEKGSFTLNQSSPDTIELDAGGGSGGTPPETYKTYEDTITALTAQSGFKTYAQTSAALLTDGFKTYSDTVKALSSESGFKTYVQTSAQLSNDGYATQAWIEQQKYATNAASLSDVTATIFDFGDGDISAFGWSNVLNPSDLTAVGIKNGTGTGANNWIKRPKSVRIGEGIVGIAGYVFNNCTSLTIITAPACLSTLDSCSFQDCSSLKIVDFPGLLTYGNDVFKGCTGLQHVEIPSGVTRIMGGDFYGCTSLSHVTIPATVNSIESTYSRRAFGNCTSLTSITVEGKTQKEAEDLLSNESFPQGYQIKTWNFAPSGDYLSASLSTDLSTDVTIGSQKLPTGNAIAHSITSNTQSIMSNVMLPLALNDIKNAIQVAGSISNSSARYTTQIAGWYLFQFSCPAVASNYFQIDVSIKYTDGQYDRHKSIFSTYAGSNSSRNMLIQQILYLPAGIDLESTIINANTSSTNNGGAIIYLMKEGYANG